MIAGKSKTRALLAAGVLGGTVLAGAALPAQASALPPGQIA